MCAAKNSGISLADVSVFMAYNAQFSCTNDFAPGLTHISLYSLCIALFQICLIVSSHSMFQCLFFLVSSSTWDSLHSGGCRLVPISAYSKCMKECKLVKQHEGKDNKGILVNC